MCLAVPGRILTVTGTDPIEREGRVDFGGVVRLVSLAFVPEAVVGDYVLVHVGFAITVLDAAQAQRVRASLAEIEEIEP
jgi:hydrogenase expression/formation protein HypC